MKTAIIGLDGLDPVVLTTLLPELPTFSRLMQNGHWGRLESCHPPITVPAWSCMSTGLTPGELGIYGFTNRRPGQYETFIPDSRAISALRLWDYFGALGRQSIIIGMPQTAPAQPLCGYMVGGQVVGTTEGCTTYPPFLARDLERLAGGRYVPDTISHRRGSPEEILAEARDNTSSSFRLATALTQRHYWDLLWLVIMAPDRVQHAALPSQMDFPALAASPVGEYYRFLDKQLAAFIKELPQECHLLLVSDHGTRPCRGTFWLNRWLRQEGYLELTATGEIDWSKTRVWGQGGYYGRIYINVYGREPRGLVPPEQLPALKEEISSKLQKITTPWPEAPNIVHRPEELYPLCRQQPPDLMLYAASLSARVIGLLDQGTSIWNDKPQKVGQLDQANHSQYGLWISNRPDFTPKTIYDIVPGIRRLAAI